MQFSNYYEYPYKSRRASVFARNGMACSSSPIASQVGLDIMKQGGNAIDAALAMATTLALVEPTSNGLGSDCFAQIWTGGKLYGINGSGRAPKTLDANIVKSMGYSEMPISGWIPTMVPGAPAAWAEISRRFGTLPLAEIMKPAIKYAREGFCIPVTVAQLWKAPVERFCKESIKNKDIFSPWFECFTKNGKPYEAGDIFCNPYFADTLESLAETDCRSFYSGEIMQKIVDFSKKTGGFFSEEDFMNYKAEWVEPISVNYRGYDVFEIPPNGHGITVLMALNILNGLELSDDRNCADTYHKIIESIKLAFADAKKYVADPDYMKTSVNDMLSEEYASVRRSLISNKALYPEAGIPFSGGTVYFCTADGNGNMVSFIQSGYNDFGSGITVPETGICIQNRGANFSLDSESDNCLSGGKRAYHTIIPGFLVKDGKPVGPFGVMGGFMQPQGQVQILVNSIDYGMNPQAALDTPRFQWIGEKRIEIEREAEDNTVQALSEMGHDISYVDSNIMMGRGQIIWRRDDGVLIGGTEPRTDGTICSW